MSHGFGPQVPTVQRGKQPEFTEVSLKFLSQTYPVRQPFWGVGRLQSHALRQYDTPKITYRAQKEPAGQGSAPELGQLKLQ